MKPLHVGLLVIGAALAGGLAVKMSQPPAYRAAARIATAPALRTNARVPAQPVQPEPAPPVTPADAGASVTAAPPARYEEARSHPTAFKPATAKPAPAKVAPAPPRVTPASSPVTAPQVEIAKAETSIPAAAPYEAPPAAQDSIAVQPALPDPAPPNNPPAPLQASLHQGTEIAVRLDQALSSDHLFSGDSFQASLAEPLVADGYIVAERGARVSGRVVASKSAGRLSGTSELQLSLSYLQTADGQKIAISTEPWSKQGDSGRGQEVAKIGGGAALGAIIGAIAGGGKGAAIGAGVGGAVGTGAAAANRGKPVSIPSETVLRFRLASRVTVTERQL